MSESARPHSEKQEWQFREPRFPPRLFYLLRDQKITSSDLLILVIIDSLVKPQGARDDEKGLGCFANNAYIADAVNIHKNHAGRQINKLAEMGLVVISNWNGRRYLECEWSRTAEEREALEGPYGKALRTAYRELTRRVAPLNKNVDPPLNKNVDHNNSCRNKKEKENEETRSAENGGGETHTRPSGLFGRNNKPTKTKSSDPKDVAAARQLKEALRKNNRQVIESSKWPESFRLLREEDRQDYTEVLNWFCEHCSKEDERKLGLPSIASAKQFRKHYGTWIEPIYNKTAKPNPHKKRPMENGQSVFTDEEIRTVRKRVDNETAAKFGVNRRDQCTPEVWEKIDWFKARLKEKIDEEYGGDITNRLLSTERMA